MRPRLGSNIISIQIIFYKYATAQPLFIIIKIQQNHNPRGISYLLKNIPLFTFDPSRGRILFKINSVSINM